VTQNMPKMRLLGASPLVSDWLVATALRACRLLQTQHSPTNHVSGKRNFCARTSF